METITNDLHPRQKIGKYTVKNKYIGGTTKKVSYILISSYTKTFLNLLQILTQF